MFAYFSLIAVIPTLSGFIDENGAQFFRDLHYLHGKKKHNATGDADYHCRQSH